MTASTPFSTPSKASVSADTPPRHPPSSTTDSPLTLAMRQAGFEAAKKAGDAKKTNDAKISAKIRGSERSNTSSEPLQKLDNSTPTGMPPPSGVTEASSAKATVTGDSNVKSKADTITATTSGPPQAACATTGKPTTPTDGSPGDSGIHDSETKEIVPEESKGKNHEAEKTVAMKDDDLKAEPQQGKVGYGTEQSVDDSEGTEKSENATASDAAQDLPVKITQNQSAGNGVDVGESVAD